MIFIYNLVDLKQLRDLFDQGLFLFHPSNIFEIELILLFTPLIYFYIEFDEVFFSVIN